MVVVEPGIGRSGQLENAVPNVGGQAPPRRAAPIAVKEGLEPSVPVPRLQALELANAQPQGPGPLIVRDLLVDCGLDQTRPPGLLTAHRDSPHRGDTFT